MSLDEATDLLEQSDAGQIPSPLPPQPRSRARSLFFSGSQPEADPWSDQGIAAAAADMEETSRLLDGDGSASGDESLSDPDESLSETSGSASSADGGGPLKPLGKAALRATTRKGVLIATSAAHRIAARHELEKAAGLYIADEQDQELIGDPVANLLHRRGGIVGNKMSEDANDAVSALMGLANYIGKQVALTVEIGQMKAAGVQIQPTPGDA
jgi:hypothetical protein